VRTIGAFQEYNVDLSKLYNWLPWGGLISPQVIRNKDGSLMGFIRYEKVAHNHLKVESGQTGEENSEVAHYGQDFGPGWAIWSELCHCGGRDELTLTLCWNPFHDKQSSCIINALTSDGLPLGKAEEHFEAVLQELCRDMESYGAKLLQYEEAMRYLGSTLTGEPCQIAMYNPPIYLDAVLSRGVDFRVFGAKTDKKNELEIGGKAITVATPLGEPELPIMGKLFEAFHVMDYRFVRRFLFWDEAGTMKQLNGYMRTWCKGRRTLKDFMSGQLLKSFNGVFTEAFIFRMAEDERGAKEKYMSRSRI